MSLVRLVAIVADECLVLTHKLPVEATKMAGGELNSWRV